MPPKKAKANTKEEIEKKKREEARRIAKVIKTAEQTFLISTAKFNSLQEADNLRNVVIKFMLHHIEHNKNIEVKNGSKDPFPADVFNLLDSEPVVKEVLKKVTNPIEKPTKKKPRIKGEPAPTEEEPDEPEPEEKKEDPATPMRKMPNRKSISMNNSAATWLLFIASRFLLEVTSNQDPAPKKKEPADFVKFMLVSKSLDTNFESHISRLVIPAVEQYAFWADAIEQNYGLDQLFAKDFDEVEYYSSERFAILIPHIRSYLKDFFKILAKVLVDLIWPKYTPITTLHLEQAFRVLALGFPTYFYENKITKEDEPDKGIQYGVLNEMKTFSSLVYPPKDKVPKKKPEKKPEAKEPAADEAKTEEQPKPRTRRSKTQDTEEKNDKAKETADEAVKRNETRVDEPKDETKKPRTRASAKKEVPEEPVYDPEEGNDIDPDYDHEE